MVSVPPVGGIAAWLNPRRKRFWAVVLVVLYTLAGFFAVPALVKSQIVKTAGQRLGREAEIQRVAFNPYVLSLKIDGFALRDPDGERVAGFDEFFANFQLSSLFRWAWTFRELRLDGPQLLFERYAPGDSRLSRILRKAEETAAPDDGGDDDGSLPRLLLHNLSLNGGEVRFVDHVPSTPVELDLGPLNVAIQQLNTLPERHGMQSVDIRLPDGADLSWQGDIRLSPLESEGDLVLRGARLGLVAAYLEGVLPLDSLQATLGSRLHYHIGDEPGGKLGIALDNMEAELTDVSVSGLTPGGEFLSFPSLALSGGRLRYPEGTLQIGKVTLKEPALNAWLDPEGKLNLLQLLPETSEAGEAVGDSTASGPPGWTLEIDEFLLQGGHMELSDASVDPPARLAARNVNLKLNDVSNQDAQTMPATVSGELESGGSFRFDGRITALPGTAVEGEFALDGVALAAAQPYLQQSYRLAVDGGALNAQARVEFSDAIGLRVDGSADVASLEVSETAGHEPLIAWKQLAVDRFELDDKTRRLNLSMVSILAPWGRVLIDENRELNLSELALRSDEVAAEPDPAASEWALTIGGIEVKDGSMDFSDLSLPLPFATKIQALDGTVSTIATGSAEPATLRLEGQVADYGLARIDGTMNVLDPVGHTDISVEFRNLLMSELSPYSIEFAGRKIDEGKLNLDLNYRVEAGQLAGENNIVMSDLLLGEKVDSPDAVSLPLGLAVALLTDANGVIDIDLPVEGDVNDPEFRIGGIVWQAFVGLITKVATAPFRLLGSLVGVDSEEFGQFRFLAGRYDLTPPELEEIGKLREALQERPELAVEVAGVFDPAVDGPRLQYFRLRDTVLERLGREAGEGNEEIPMLDQAIRSVLESLYAERVPDADFDALKAAASHPPEDDPEGKPVLDELAYSAALRDRLLALEEITADDLAELANARATAIRNAFLAGGEFDPARIVTGEATQVTSEDGEWVVLELGVAAE